MPRTIAVPPDLSGAALAALKAWLAISISAEDALLVRLLASAHETCAGFTGFVPLACQAEEMLAARPGWQRLATRPVRSVASLTWRDAAGADQALEAARWSHAIEPDGTASVRLDDPPPGGRVVVNLSTGIAEDWAALSPALGEGILRLAAHAYRSRDAVAAQPPAAVAALWRAWRRLRL